jgi:hypothetical protein
MSPRIPCAVILAMIVTLSAAPARAQVEALDPVPSRLPRLPMPTADPVHRPGPHPRFERSLLGAQIAVAEAIPIAAILVATNAGADWKAVMFVSPLVAGTLVGAVGNSSDVYKGSYAMAIVGAYMGAGTAFPLFVLGFNGHGGDAVSGNAVAAVVLGGIGWFVLQPVASIGLWHLTKHPGNAPPPASHPTRPAFPGRLPAGPSASLLPGEATAPLLSLAF